MKLLLLVLCLSCSSFFGVMAILSPSPRKMILGWAGVGVFQSIFFLVIGFELVALLNIFFTVGSATVIKIFSSLYGQEEIRRTESSVSMRNWIYGVGQTLTLGAILLFSFSDTTFVDAFREDLATSVFSDGMVERFPELPWVLGFILFLILIVGSTVARPAWKKVQGASK